MDSHQNFTPFRKIFNFSTPVTARQSQYGLIKFEDDPGGYDDDGSYGLINSDQSGHNFKFEDETDDNVRPSQILKFEDSNRQHEYEQTVQNVRQPGQVPIFEHPNRPNLGESQGYGFQDSNGIEDTKPQKKKRRRRRRKPRYQGLLQGYPGFAGSQQPLGPHQSPGFPVQGLPGPGVGQYPYPGSQAGQFYSK